jgi:BlaI family transcriptional regulator, penicillinase repressor
VGREKTIRLTKFELEIMHTLWEINSGSVREIQERLPEKRRPAYTTVQTIVRRLEEKGAVRRLKKIGNAFIFEAVVTRKSAHRRLIEELLESFGGSARPLMAHLAESGKLSLADLKELETMLPTDDSSRQPEASQRDRSARRARR